MPSASSDLIKIRAYYMYCMFPKAPNILGMGNNTYGITNFEIVEVLEGSPVKNRNYSVTITGEFFEPLKKGVIYTILAKQVIHPVYGVQYNLIYINEQVDLNKLTNQKAFLSSFLTKGQIAELYKVHENPLAIIAAHDIEGLKQVHGIGDYIANCIIERFEANKDMSRIYVELNDYGLTPNFIRKLIKTYRSPNALIDIVKNHPYQLTYDVEGVGFKTADEIALRGGISPKDVKRVGAYIRYFLETEALEHGNSYVTAGELLSNIHAFFGGQDNIVEDIYDENGESVGTNISVAITELQESNILVVEEGENKSRRRVYLTYYYNLEKEIAYHLKRLLKSDNNFKYDNWMTQVSLLEEKQGFAFDETQIKGIKLGLDSQVCIITGGAGCVDANTEFFNGTQWKKISEYQKGDKVLQWVPPKQKGYTKELLKENNVLLSNSTAELVTPLEYIKVPCDTLYHFETKYGVSQTVCDEHRVVYATSKLRLTEDNILNIREKINQKSWKGRFITTFNYGGSGIDLTDEEIRVMVAVMADGSFLRQTNHCRFHIKKERKKERLKRLFKEANIPLTERPSAEEGYNDYYADVPRREKTFGQDWYNCTNEQLKIIIDEIQYWDSHIDYTPKGIKRITFSTTIKETADFIQFAYSACGIRATISISNRTGKSCFTANKEYTRKSIEYRVCSTTNNLIGLTVNKDKYFPNTEITTVPTTDGYKYCFRVPSTYLILRNNDKIFITGNCGKSSLVAGILAGLEGYNFAQTSLSGKAAARLQEVTGVEGKTIHRLLEYAPGIGFARDEKNPLTEDIIVLDEISMVGGEIFLSLLKAIPNGTKLIMCGDVNQLESIGALNLANDMLKSHIIPSTELTVVHRQAAKSGILTIANEVRQQHSFFDNHFEGRKKLGELEDMLIDISSERNDTLERSIQHYKNLFNSNLVKRDVMSIQLLAPVKERGDACVYNLNIEAQKIVNPLPDDYDENEVFQGGTDEKPFFIHKNDKVMCIKNNYRVFTVSHKECAIFNGWTGIVKDIKDGYLRIHFPLNEEDVVMDYDTASNSIILGYASTTHKYQGSEVPIVIGVLDYTCPPSMLTRQWLYTMITRAKKMCMLVGQNAAINKAIATDYISTKRTFLQELLNN